MKSRTPRIRVEDAITRYGGKRPLADYLGVTTAAVMMWRSRRMEFLPALRAWQVVVQHPDLALPPEGLSAAPEPADTA